ncbi:MAG TPA: hypothetical protein PLP33_24645 [Leptospiraceae bacterium]|nr:hypothetical protein [Leptospiraceae bacterium]
MSQELKDFINGFLIESKHELENRAYEDSNLSHEDFLEFKEIMENGNIFEMPE